MGWCDFIESRRHDELEAAEYKRIQLIQKNTIRAAEHASIRFGTGYVIATEPLVRPPHSCFRETCAKAHLRRIVGIPRPANTISLSSFSLTSLLYRQPS